MAASNLKMKPPPQLKPRTPGPTPPTFTEVLVPEDQVQWRRKVIRRWPVVVRIERHGRLRDRRSVHAKWDMPGNALATFYRGRVLKTCSLDDKIKHWFTTIPGLRGLYVLDSKIEGMWTWARFVAEGSVGGFLNSSRNFAGSPANYSGANCKIVWFLKSYGPQNLGENNSNVYAAIFTKKPVRKGDALVWDYPWKY